VQDGGQLGRNPWCKAGQGRSDVFLPKIQGDPGVTTRKVIHFVITVAHEVFRVGRVEHGRGFKARCHMVVCLLNHPIWHTWFCRRT